MGWWWWWGEEGGGVKMLFKDPNQLMQQCTVRTAWSDSDHAAVHSCNSW